MTRFWSYLCVSALAMTAAALPAAAQNQPVAIAWTTNLDAALADSARSGRPVLAYLTYNACFWCKRLEQETYPDPAVVEASRRFICVELNRDVDPAPVEQFNCFSFPTLIVLGTKKEKVYRFEGYMQPADLVARLDEGLRRYDLYKAGKEWDTPAERPPTICTGAAVETFKAPSEGVPAGIARLGDTLWIAQTDPESDSGAVQLFDLDGRTAAVRRTFRFDESITDLATDGKALYAVTYDWTAGGPILVIDPASGEVTRRIVTEANKANHHMDGKGIEWVDGKLYVLEGGPGTIREVDPATGAISATISPGRTWVGGLAFDGTNFITGTRDKLVLIDRASGAITRDVPVNYPLRSIGWHDGTLDLMEQPVFGFDQENKQTRIWPRQMLVHEVRLAPPAR